MRINNDIKLDYDDVLIRPKRSTLRSRSEVSLERTFTFPHSNTTWTGIPIMVANMDAVATISMAKAMTKNHIMVAMSKFIKPKTFSALDPEYNFFTIGIRDNDYEYLLEQCDPINYIPPTYAYQSSSRYTYTCGAGCLSNGVFCGDGNLQPSMEACDYRNFVSINK